MNTVELSERFGKMWKDMRTEAGYSQTQAAKAIGVSRATIENWENGTSSPSQKQGFIYFQKLGIQPLPYYLRVLYPVEFKDIPSATEADEIDQALITLIKDLPPESKKKILYIMYGAHGSSPSAVLEMVCAHLHTPLFMRVGVAALIRSNYLLAASVGRLICGDRAAPDVDLLEKATKRAMCAVQKKEDKYTATL